ncbi:RNA polymerase sigma-70 factor (ECF subfamily) [Filimonas zeae]|uniref:DNA-directed RNA polymerase sigma-70 factor n=1 Tax=Filimonas zeae TaxID=1737353 RepID=A0A917MR63_9BACT|nr:sigma-70 family RNA polymerase sigma factor [Filimonas zeae]MDR6337604.1 RNA polymerase sigma-70 factor (ECF subfamily) [Filimonas zeae]GGH59410.1 DNA-directed RNA polymerase sigma-70 factor [Filimonas zeae]
MQQYKRNKLLKTIRAYDEGDLLARIANGEEQAFDVVYNELYPRLVYFARRYVAGEPDIEEVVNESFVKFWMRRNRFDALTKIKSFLYTTTRNALINLLSKNKVTPVIALEEDTLEGMAADDDPFYRREAILSDVLGALFHEIEQLPEKCREVVLLTYRDGLNTAEVAERMGISVSNVTSQRSRAMQLLRLALAERYPVALTSLCFQWLNHFFSGF